MDRKNAFDRFDLYDDLVFDDDIHAVTTIESDILIDDRERHLPPVGDLRLSQFKA